MKKLGQLQNHLFPIASVFFLILSANSLHAVDPANWFAYVTDSGIPFTEPSGTPGVFFIDSSTNQATKIVKNDTSIPFETPLGVAISPDGNFAYVSDFVSSAVYLIDTRSNHATQTVKNLTGSPFIAPVGLAISPNGKFAYMADFETPAVFFIDVATNSATQTVTNPFNFSNPDVIAISPDSTFAYVTDSLKPSIFRIETATNEVTAEVSGASFQTPQGLAIGPNGSFAYVVDGYAAAVYRIDTTTNVAAITTTSPFNSPNGVAISPDGSTAYVSDSGNTAVYYIDTATNTITRTVSVPSEGDWFCNSLATTPDGKYLLVGGGNDPVSTIYSVDIDTGAVAQVSNISGIAYVYPTWPAFGLLQIATVGLMGNNMKMANYLNANAPASVLSLLFPLQGGALNAALKSAAPTRNAFLTFATQTTQIAMGRILNDQLRQNRWRSRASLNNSVAATLSPETLLVFAGKKIAPSQPMQNPNEARFSVWSGGFGEYIKEKAQNQSPAFSAGSGGVVAAWDYKGAYAHPVGVGLAYAHTHLHENQGAGSANIDQGDLFAYGTFKTGAWYFDTALWGGYYHAKNIRKISFTGFSGEATMKTHGWQLSPHLEIGYDYRSGWFGVEPFTLLDWVNCWEKGTQETGAGMLNMGQAGRYCSLLRTETGLHFEEILTYGWGTVTFMEKGSYAYQKTFHTGRINAFLLGSPGSFTVNTLTGAQNLGVGEVEVLFTPKCIRYPYASLSYHIELGSNYQSHEGMIKIGGDF